MRFSMSFPVIFIIIRKPSTTGTRLKSPNRQSKASNRKSSPMGVAIAPALSGSLCARYVSVAALELFTILRSFPLPYFSVTRIVCHDGVSCQLL